MNNVKPKTHHDPRAIVYLDDEVEKSLVYLDWEPPAIVGKEERKELTNLSLEGVTSLEYLLEHCSFTMPVLDLSNWDTSAIIDIRYMFPALHSALRVIIADFDFSSLHNTTDNMRSLFELEQFHIMGKVTMPSWYRCKTN